MGYADTTFVNNPPEQPVNVSNAVTDAALVLLSAALRIAQGADASALTGLLAMGAVSDSPMAYVDGEARPLPLSALGAVRVSPVAPLDMPDILAGPEWDSPPFDFSFSW